MTKFFLIFSALFFGYFTYEEVKIHYFIKHNLPIKVKLERKPYDCYNHRRSKNYIFVSNEFLNIKDLEIKIRYDTCIKYNNGDSLLLYYNPTKGIVEQCSDNRIFGITFFSFLTMVFLFVSIYYKDKKTN